MPNRLLVVTAPHIRDNYSSTTRTMVNVLIALLPASFAAVWFFGMRSLFLILWCVACCALFEAGWCYMRKQKIPLADCSFAVTGVLLALNLPVSMPFWMAAIGCFVAIVVVKQLFGGLGQNFANPAIAARIVLLTSFADAMTHWPVPNGWNTVDAVASATPLAMLWDGAEVLPSYAELFWGNHGGCIGETCAPALILGLIYLVATKVIRPTIPVIYVGVVALLSWILGYDPLYQILSGGLLLGAIFMATDYSTSPITEWGRALYAVCLAVLTVIIRIYGSYPEGVSYAILLMNLVTPLIDRWVVRRPFGAAKEVK